MGRNMTCASASASLLLFAALAYAQPVVPTWGGTTPRDLHREYNNIFRHGNRNAASHLWSTFLFDRAPQMTSKRFEDLSAGYCAVSGSPVTPGDYTRYLLRLPSVEGGGKTVQGFMYYCCWPCVCDTQDFIRVDTANVTLAGGEVRRYHVAVLGNACENQEALNKPFMQPFGHGMTTLAQSASEVRCGADGSLLGATLSDHGYPIISIFFDAVEIAPGSQQLMPQPGGEPTPGRKGHAATGGYQDEYEYKDMCEDRARNGYNSGMGEIFRKVAEISPVVPGSRPRLAAQRGEDDASNQTQSDSRRRDL